MAPSRNDEDKRIEEAQAERIKKLEKAVEQAIALMELRELFDDPAYVMCRQVMEGNGGR